MNFVLIYGPPAAGKLTVATELSKLTGYQLLDNHKVVDYLAELFPRSNHEYDQIRSELGRKIRLDVFEAAGRCNMSMIATFAPISAGAHDFIRDTKDRVERSQGTFCLVHLSPDLPVLEKRVGEASRKNKKIETVERLHEVLEGNSEATATFPDFPHVVINNTARSPQEVAKMIITQYRLFP